MICRTRMRKYVVITTKTKSYKRHKLIRTYEIISLSNEKMAHVICRYHNDLVFRTYVTLSRYHDIVYVSRTLDLVYVVLSTYYLVRTTQLKLILTGSNTLLAL